MASPLTIYGSTFERSVHSSHPLSTNEIILLLEISTFFWVKLGLFIDYHEYFEGKID